MWPLYFWKGVDLEASFVKLDPISVALGPAHFEPSYDPGQIIATWPRRPER